MPPVNALLETLSYFKQLHERKLQEAQSALSTVQQLQRELGETPSGIEVPLNLAEPLPAMADRVENLNGKRPDIRPDEFFGLTHGEASKKYLKKIGHAVSFEELVEALQSGGCKVGGDNPRRVLYISLIRNTRDFVPPQPGYIGLREFYPTGGRSRRRRDTRDGDE